MKDNTDQSFKRLKIQYASIQEDVQEILSLLTSHKENFNKISILAERLEKIEYDMGLIKLSTGLINSEIQLIKIRTEKLQKLLLDADNSSNE